MPKGFPECLLGVGWSYSLEPPLSLWLCYMPCPTVLLWAHIHVGEGNGRDLKAVFPDKVMAGE